jgi:hypothetical protein
MTQQEARPSHGDQGDGTTRQRAPQKHLMTPGKPRPPQRRSSMSTSQVQKWVLSSLAVITLGHLAAGLVVAAIFPEEARPGARIGLLLIAGIFGVIAVAAGRAIHQKRLLSSWLLVGFLPTLIGAYFVYWR